MNPDDFSKFLKLKGKEVEAYANNVFPKKAGELSLRFIDKNFRDQGWHGNTFEPWKKIKREGTILVKTGTLRRGNFYTTANGIAHVQNNVKYAAAHNNGFHGAVQVKSHQRRLIAGKKQFTGRTLKSSGKAQTKTIHSVSGITTVKAHTCIMNIPKRQFFPTSWNDSPVLVKDMQTEIYNHIRNQTFKR